MKRPLRRMALTTGVAMALTSTIFATGAAAATPGDTATTNNAGIRVVAQAHTATGGWGEYAIDDTADDITIQVTESVGGGIWSHGATTNLIGQKVCYSQYRHNSVSHGSSVTMDGSKDSDWVGPGAVSDANITKYTTATCRTYWSK
ncbi:lactococcin 972 family bacteriocin [Saccharomonospora xinjiangensis]|uniref:Bacteriocin (Lactococcin_972) n=1 Tax=Saccharomonospora xinjiangensis XJ-54 TaxID=882086 RepID=I0V8M0_9PSEU|nr:lactococcin 972 family bacteriocin [Saccharomonospora xinjiangensis]EID56473.1 Bacteriocin (Lactococcin_972) [Saccharomonospora xinjiangensis XJ-54]